jgi:hypothetical protein
VKSYDWINGRPRQAPMGTIIPFPDRSNRGPEPFRFSLTVTGDEDGCITLDAQYSRAPPSMPQLPDVLLSLAAWIESGCPCQKDE